MKQRLFKLPVVEDPVVVALPVVEELVPVVCEPVVPVVCGPVVEDPVVVALPVVEDVVFKSPEYTLAIAAAEADLVCHCQNPTDGMIPKEAKYCFIQAFNVAIPTNPLLASPPKKGWFFKKIKNYLFVVFR